MAEIDFERRRFISGLLIAGAAALPVFPRLAGAQASLPKMIVTKDPSCGCCGSWIAHVRAAGFAIDVVETSDIDRVKNRLGVPADLASCHTAEIDGYVIEGHVPQSVIRRLLAEKPSVIGIAVPGMPASAPGMDVPGALDFYDVIQFSASGRRRYARFQGLREIRL